MPESLLVFVVLGARVELAHPCGRWILSPLRLPIPPSEHAPFGADSSGYVLPLVEDPL
jgi:hypothetical protein